MWIVTCRNNLWLLLLLEGGRDNVNSQSPVEAGNVVRCSDRMAHLICSRDPGSLVQMRFFREGRLNYSLL